ncbi:MAG: DNA replication/repair protein RecF [Alphaproteobacteria bacterium RIFOXYD12_FULL_60_8]|nr:MAG: DNA replication/repair protein RecF [Alphaproteobacteria bacterium RIFOXYD12_FULL_60_8]
MTAALSALGVVRLTLTDFRCYEFLRLELDPRPVVLTGPNGAGKTNILEALSFLVPGRGLRRVRLSEAARHGAVPGHAWGVAATVHGTDGPVDIGTGREPGPIERRVVRIDGQTMRSQTSLGEVLSAVWLTPAMDGLFRDGASARRRFLDRLVLGHDPDHAGRTAAYEQALRERSRLLKDGKSDSHWLSALEDTMVRHGMAVAAARREVVARLNAACAADEGPFPKAQLTLTGDLETWLDHASALEAEDRLRVCLSTARSPDAEHGGAAYGPHRSDLSVRHLDKGMDAHDCSTGEQKAMLVAIVLAQARVQAARRGAAPLLLLDEIAAHLDETRRRALYTEIIALGAQAWMTGTDRAMFAGLGEDAQFLHVENARLERIAFP